MAIVIWTQVLNTAGDYSTLLKGLIWSQIVTIPWMPVSRHMMQRGNVGIVGTQKAYGIDVSVDPAFVGFK